MIFKVYADCSCGCGKRGAIKSSEPIVNPPPFHHGRPWVLPEKQKPASGMKKLWIRITGRKG